MNLAVGIDDALPRIGAHPAGAHVMPDPSRIFELLIGARAAFSLNRALNPDRLEVANDNLLRGFERVFGQRRKSPIEFHAREPELVARMVEQDATVWIGLRFQNGQKLPMSGTVCDRTEMCDRGSHGIWNIPEDLAASQKKIGWQTPTARPQHQFAQFTAARGLALRRDRQNPASRTEHPLASL